MFLQDVNNTIKAAGGSLADHNQTIELSEQKTLIQIFYMIILTFHVV